MNCVIPYREFEKMYICLGMSSIIVIFSINFNDPVEQGLARIMLFEFNDAKKHLKIVKNPPVTKYFDLIVPDEVKLFEKEPHKISNGYLAFSIFKECITSNITPMLDLLINCRTYIQFNIHSLKGYLYSRMRKKTDQFASLIIEA